MCTTLIIAKLNFALTDLMDTFLKNTLRFIFQFTKFFPSFKSYIFFPCASMFHRKWDSLKSKYFLLIQALSYPN